MNVKLKYHGMLFSISKGQSWDALGLCVQRPVLHTAKIFLKIFALKSVGKFHFLHTSRVQQAENSRTIKVTFFVNNHNVCKYCLIVYQMGRLCGRAHEISGIKALIFLCGWTGGGGIGGGGVGVGGVGWGCRVGGGG